MKYSDAMGKSLLQSVAKGLLGRFLAYGTLAAGFLLLYRGFQAGSLGAGVPFGLGGGAAILIGMYLMVSVRRGEPSMAPLESLDLDNEEDGAGDPFDRSNQGG
ncbi:MAG: hypothetical protein BZY80_01995 [SAR202 cluster bacterium Io17-Chloro-G2]|nr:MAG: hypothetical protein BZY80_01995 [SAR202 cluster bacterium Io17-Chloro-G2]